jgi:hypothetical protein
MHHVEGWPSSGWRASLSDAMRRLGLLLAVLVLAALGAFAAIAFFNARDDAGVGTSASDAAPGVPLSQLGDVGTTRIDTPPGNVVVLYSDAAQRAQLQALADDIAGPTSPDLEQAGQAVIVRRDGAAGGIVAIAGDQGIRVTDPADPNLRAFVEGRLGADAG